MSYSVLNGTSSIVRIAPSYYDGFNKVCTRMNRWRYGQMYIKFAPKINSPSLPLVAIDAGYEKITRTEKYDWPFYQIVCCYQGEGMVRIGEDSIELKPGQLFLIKPGTVHEYHYEGHMYQLSWVSFNGYLADNLMQQYGIEPPYVAIKDTTHPSIHLDILSVLEEVENYFVIDRVSFYTES